jgi:uncharacterized protein YkwD
MRIFFAFYLFLLFGVFVLWSIEPIHRAEVASSSPEQTLASATFANASTTKPPEISVAKNKTAPPPLATQPTESVTTPSTTPIVSPPAEPPTIIESATTSPIEPQKPTPPSSDEELAIQIENGIHIKINEERSLFGLPALSFDKSLTSLARVHSEDMLTNNYFAHNDAQGCSSSCRLTNAGYSWQAAGENIYLMSGYQITIDKVVSMAVESWMQSPGHRANVLNPSFTHEGVGVAFEGTRLYVTEDFALPRVTDL